MAWTCANQPARHRIKINGSGRAPIYRLDTQQFNIRCANKLMIVNYDVDVSNEKLLSTNQLSHVGHAKIINQLTKSLLHCQLNYASPASITARRRSLANWPSTLSWKPSTTQAGSVVNKEHLLSSQTQTGCHYYFYTQQSTMFRIKTDTEDQK